MSLFVKDKALRRKHCKDFTCYPNQYIPPTKAPRPPRVVPPFSYASLYQKNVIVTPFKSTAALIKPYPIGNTEFKDHYTCGDVPISIQFDAVLGMRLLWSKNFNEIDVLSLLPAFFEGLCEVKHPFPFFTEQGITELLMHCKSDVISILPKIVVPIKNAFNTRDLTVVSRTLRILQVLVSSSEPVGEALVPFYRQILPPLNLYGDLYEDLGDGIDYGQRRKENIAELLQETLETLELYGGPNAFINIKYIIPTYQSFVKNM